MKFRFAQSFIVKFKWKINRSLYPQVLTKIELTGRRLQFEEVELAMILKRQKTA